VTQVSWSWLQDYVNRKLARTLRQAKVPGKSLGKLAIECDEMWSFVDRKKNEVYIWLAIDRSSRKIVGCFVGDRTRKSARKLWASLPEVYQQSDESLYRFLASATLQLFPLNVIALLARKRV